MKLRSDGDPIVALATPWGQSALAVLRLSGPGTLRLLAGSFRGRRDLRQAEGSTLCQGLICDPRTGERIDQVLVAVYRAPRSYTGEESAEVFCHGSPAIIRRLLALLRATGFRFAEPGEFTLRAFLHGKLDLTRAEAVNELVRARTDRARSLALNRLCGSIEAAIRRVQEGLVPVLAAVELHLDYPPEELDPAADLAGPEALAAGVERAMEELRRLLVTYGIGRLLQEGLTVVIAGRPNAGKSTLFNRLLREDRAIVSEIPGTTRDYLEGGVAVNGIPLRLVDTAGLRGAGGPQADPLEAEGIRRTEHLIRHADLVLYLVDAVVGVTPEDAAVLGGEDAASTMQSTTSAAAASGASSGAASPPGVASSPDGAPAAGRLIRLWNKVDRCPRPAPPGFLPVSAERGDGLEALARAIEERALGGAAGAAGVESGEPVIDSLRQKELLERALAALGDVREGLSAGAAWDLLAVDLQEAVDALGEITGEVTTADILERMFRDFCVGK